MEGSSFSAYFERLPLRRRRLLQTALAGGAGATLASALAACGGQSASSSSTGTEGNFPSHPKWNFVFINHVTTNPFFVPTQYGIQDACALVGCTYQWTGSANSIVKEMVDAFNAAIAAKADGIAVAIIDPTAFDDPVNRALDAGIPVVAYNADAPAGSKNRRLAYIGQDLYQSGYRMGQRVVSLVGSGDVVGFIATPGSLNIQPRIDGARQAILDSKAPINFVEVATGAQVEEELSRIEAYYLGHPNLKGMFAVDAGSTQGVAQVMEKYNLASKGVHGGGYDLLTKTLQEIQAGNLDFTIDQQPYLQGFYPVIQLFLYLLSGGLMVPSDTDTGLLFVTKENVGPYLRTQTRFEGSSSKEQLVPRS
ncbi:sugar ABC transporter substrate-binding protein [Thermogemmatispora tikiterensis]|uniref:sugar ABC transporter substrate-binding protein n=1 Tax=Thermogemmatispora tikiterensis TaxID=1825093 RepID=UPI001CB93A43|nr:sugar ABC transporter substrate-binding protein [Thermogemmatispora tikiterensis]